MLRFIVIGITDDPHPWFPPEVLAAINGGRVFSGGRRHREIVAGLLPEGAQWIDITVPLAAMFERYRELGGGTAESDQQHRLGRGTAESNQQRGFVDEDHRTAPLPCRNGNEDHRVAPLPCRGGVGGGVGDFILCGGELQTPPPTPPLDGRGERMREADAMLSGDNGEGAAAAPLPCRNGNEDHRVAPLPCRGGAGGGVGDFNLCGGKLQTPPPTPPLDGRGERTALPTASLEGRGEYTLDADAIANKRGERTLDADAIADWRGEQAPGVTTIVVFASGDPLFFGFANTLRREFPGAAMRVYPAFNSLQTLAHRLLMPYHDMRIVSLTGRPWQELDRALIERAPLIGILTDREKTPTAIARRCREYGFEGYRVFVGERLGNPELERISQLLLTEAAEHEFTMPNCLILSLEAAESQEHGLLNSTDHHSDEKHGLLTSRLSFSRSFGLPDSSFALLDGREKMITKMPIRLLTLQALELPRASVFWDVGACTGSVSIEARMLFPHLRVVAFEIRHECEAIIRENCHRHGAPGIEVHIGDFRSVCRDDIATYGTPDAVFIGGHGGRLKDIMAIVLTVLAPGGVMVMNSVVAPKVLTDSRQLWDESCQELGLQQEPPLHIQLNDNHPITILKCRR